MTLRDELASAIHAAHDPFGKSDNYYEAADAALRFLAASETARQITATALVHDFEAVWDEAWDSAVCVLAALA